MDKHTHTHTHTHTPTHTHTHTQRESHIQISWIEHYSKDSKMEIKAIVWLLKVIRNYDLPPKFDIKVQTNTSKNRAFFRGAQDDDG